VQRRPERIEHRSRQVDPLIDHWARKVLLHAGSHDARLPKPHSKALFARDRSDARDESGQSALACSVARKPEVVRVRREPQTGAS
jgi:hypothetical protein